MKPQCNTSADCLRELARVMDQFGIADTLEAVNSKYVLCAYGTETWPNDELPEFMNHNEWQFAIAEVEGKPVFIWDELYSVNFNERVKVIGKDKFDPNYLVVTDKEGNEKSLCALSWNPPKPATVMVELTVGEATKMLRYFCAEAQLDESVARGVDAIAKALKGLE